MAQAAMHRGAAFGDFDGDGRMDAAVSRIGERAELWLNRSEAAGNWLGLRLEGRRSNRDGIGARIHIVGDSGREQWNHVTISTGYGCSSDRTVHFGLGLDSSAKLVEIAWPRGVRQRLEQVRSGAVLRVTERE